MKKVLIAAGHSNAAPGAIAKNGMKEADLASELRDMVAEKLRKNGMDVVTDGDKGKNLPLQESMKLARGRFAIEIHFNSVESPLASGIECLALPDKREACQKIAKAIQAVMKTRLRGDAGYQKQEVSPHKSLGFVAVGGIIVEIAFLSNPAELAWYLAHKYDVAQAVAEVVATL